MTYLYTTSRLLVGLILFLLSIIAVANAQAEEKFTPGVVIDKVVSARDQTKSYALYLPSNYTTTRKFPVLYCFDPAARGAVPVTRFKDAAAKYEYIVVGSNNSRNGPNQPLSDIVRDLWEDTHGRFSIDDRRVYLAGFSGGARVAIGVGLWLKERIAGVIAGGAGFPVDTPTNTPRSFVLFAVAGTEDFNNPELQSLIRKLEGSSPPVRLAVFEGGHTWLPPALATDALEWLELQAMKSGIRDRNSALIDEIFVHGISQASAAEAEGDKYRAYRRYLGLAQDFTGLHDVTEVEKKAKALGASREINEAIKQDKRMEEEQNRREQAIHTLIGALGVAENHTESLIALRDELRNLREAAKATESSARRTVARRVTESLFIQFFEMGNGALARKEYEQAVNNYSICSEIQPDNPRIFVYLGRAHALAGSRNKALTALKTAAEKGYAGVQEISGPDFEILQTDKRFKEILDLVNKNQASHQ